MLNAAPGGADAESQGPRRGSGEKKWRAQADEDRLRRRGGAWGGAAASAAAASPMTASAPRPSLMTEPLLYSCFDFRLRSEIALDEIGRADDPADARPIVEIRLGPVPERLPGGGERLYGLQAAGDDALLIVENTARYLVRGGREIVVEPLPGSSERNRRLFLLGSALGILCHQRGLLPLHANAIVVESGAYAFAGPTGAGKSTLAAYFARAGYPVLCDDVCVIDVGHEGGPVAWPGLPRLKLWGDASRAFGHDSRTLDPVIDGMDKYHVKLAAQREPRPIPFRRLYLLGRAEAGAEAEIAPLRGRAAMEAIMAQTYRALYLPVLGLSSRHFLQCAALAGRIQVYTAARAWGYEQFDREAGRLARHLLEEFSE